MKVPDLQELRSIVQLNTAATAAATDAAAEQRLLRKYSRVASWTTAVIASSFALAFLLVISGTYAYSLVTARWLNPLMVKIPGIRWVGRRSYSGDSAGARAANAK